MAQIFRLQQQPSLLWTAAKTVLDAAKTVLGIVPTLINQIYFSLIKEGSTRSIKFLYLIGILSTAYKLVQKMRRLVKYYGWIPKAYLCQRKWNAKQFVNKYGQNSWVLITGFTDGIGYGYAQELAKLGFNLVLAGRNQNKINNAVKWLRQINSKNSIQIVKVDFADSLEDVVKAIRIKTQLLDVSIVINNVAWVGTVNYVDQTLPNIFSAYRVNLSVMIEINKIFIPRMTKRESRSAIINVSSVTGAFPAPRTGIYSPLKAMMDIYSQTIDLENHDKIDILSLRPLGVCTAAMKYLKGPMMITPRESALGSLKDLGHINVSFGPMKHKIGGAWLSSNSQQQNLQFFERTYHKVKNLYL